MASSLSALSICLSALDIRLSVLCMMPFPLSCCKVQCRASGACRLPSAKIKKSLHTHGILVQLLVPLNKEFSQERDEEHICQELINSSISGMWSQVTPAPGVLGRDDISPTTSLGRRTGAVILSMETKSLPCLSLFYHNNLKLVTGCVVEQEFFKLLLI